MGEWSERINNTNSSDKFEEKRFEVNEEEIGEAFEDFKKQDEQKC